MPPAPPRSDPPDPSPRSRPEDAGEPEERPARADLGRAEPDFPAGDAPRPKARAAARRKRLLRWARRAALAVLVLAALGAIAVALTVRHYEATLPSVRELGSYRPPQVTRILARDGTVLGEVFKERRTVVPLSAIPNEVKLATLAAEDAGFYEHAGLNYLGMLRALFVNLRHAGARQGGSTITQQVVKNVLLTPERTFERKVREVLLARRLEQELTKDEILELYLNHIYFGHGRYGIEEASRYYFGRGVREIGLAEAALLAGIVKGPSVYSPRVDLARARARRAFVLEQMAEKGFAPREVVEAAKAAPIALAPETDALSELAPEAVAEAQRVLRAAVGATADAGGYTVTTSIDPALQAAARAAVRKNLDQLAERHGLVAPLGRPKKKQPSPFEGTPKGHGIFHGVVTGADDAAGTIDVRVGAVTGVVHVREAARYNPRGALPSQFAPTGRVVRVSLIDPAGAARDADERERAAEPSDAPAPKPKLRLELGPQSALVAIDARSRHVLALVGGYEGVRGGLDRATQARRQPGSTFKPFVYGYALHARAMTPASLLETSPDAIAGYRPDNFDAREGGSPKRLREALAHSVNVAAVWTLERVGAANVAAWANALGIQSKLGTDPSLALGSYEVTPFELAAAYATFAAGGVYEPPQLVTKIVGPDGREVPLPPRPPPRRVMEEAEAYVLTSLLASVVERGTGTRARAIGRPIAGKTGTSNDAKDAWFAGYSTDLACVVWTGYDDAAPLGGGETGATAALPAFVDFMKKAHEGRPKADFPVPTGIVRVRIDPATGLRARPDQEDAIDEVFLAGTEPTEIAPLDAGGDAGAGETTGTDGDAGAGAAGDGTASASADPNPPADAREVAAPGDAGPSAPLPSEPPPF